MVSLMMLTAVLSFTVSPTLWWSCGAVAGVLVLYLAYLRRQTRIEEQVRRRRQQRMARSRSFAEGRAAAAAGGPRGVPLPGSSTREQWCWRSTTRIRFPSISTRWRTAEGLRPVPDLPRASGQ